MSILPLGGHRPARSAAVLAALSLALVVGAQSALGAEAVNATGKRGPWTLTDTEVDPGAFCTYGVDGNGLDGALDILEARSPRVFARNRSPRRDGQWVGIRILFQKSRNDGGTGGWQTVKSTGFVKKRAYDDKAVAIGRRAWQAGYAGSPQFRVRAQVRWYKPGTKSKVQGAATLAYEWYATGATPEMDRCLPEP